MQTFRKFKSELSRIKRAPHRVKTSWQ